MGQDDGKISETEEFKRSCNFIFTPLESLCGYAKFY